MKKMTIDGNTAASHVAYAFSEVAAIYPITPSSPMAEVADEWATAGRVNMFGQKLRLAEMQSEGGAAGAVHGSLSAGALTTTYTASQGLLLMIPNMYKIAGELLPTVFHVSARAIAAHSLNIFGDHQDVMACRQTGFAMLASCSVQEVMDLALVAHMSTLRAKVPFLHFFDGFRTSHEVSKIDVIDYDEMKKLVEDNGLMADIDDFKSRALNPEHPIQKGTAQNGDTYFQNRETANKYYLAAPAIVQEMMDKVSALTGRSYHLFDYCGAPDAENVVVMMGSGADAMEETINKMNNEGHKVGLVKVRLYRPFVADAFAAALPKTCKKIAVLDRTKEPGSLGEPLYLDVCSALFEKGMNKIKVVGGRYGLGSKEFNPSMCYAVYKNLEKKQPKNHFTVGIYDDLTNTSLDFSEKYDAAPEGAISCKFYGLGSDGTVGANKDSIKIIGDHTDMYAQAYFFYDSKKSGGITVSHLRFGKTPIQSSYLIDSADFVACHNPSYITRYDMLSDIKEGGKFLLNSSWNSLEELEKNLPAKVKQQIAKKHLKFYNIDGIGIASQIGLNGKTSTIMQSAFFFINDSIMPYEQAADYMKKAVYKKFSRKGDAVVNMNYAAIDSAKSGLVEVNYPASWATATEGAPMAAVADNEYFKEVVHPILALEGDKLPTSAFNADGSVPVGTTKFEKRGVAVKVPKWLPENCIQCNQCSFVCPHACIRPAVIDDATEKPETFVTKPTTGLKGTQFRMQVSPLDCMGCGVCANVCPGMKGNKALVMVPLDEVVDADSKNWEFAQEVQQADTSSIKRTSVKGSQFNQPLFEFSGACAGCGETPYVKVVTQMFGDRMIIANATGCSSIYGGSSPTCPNTVNKKGHGPAWANSLFEDNAEFGYGINLAYKARRAKLEAEVKQLAEMWTGDDKAACEEWLANMEDAEGSQVAADKLIKACESCKDCGKECAALCKEVLKAKDCLVKKSIWIFGGDGWAYDIGYGGLDHVLASGEDVNVMVFDTEMYSNTGGQASKASNIGEVCQFAAAGKEISKKSLSEICMTYGYIYVAQIALGANPNQAIKAISEAEAYPGPSLIIGYAPCELHGIKGGMTNCQNEMKKAVESGYWNLFTFNPALKAQGKNPFTLTSKAVDGEKYQNLLATETRYSRLTRAFPERAQKLFAENQKAAEARYEHLTRLVELYK